MLAIIWLVSEVWVAPPPSDVLALAEGELERPLATTLELRALDVAMQDGAKELSAIGTSLQSDPAAGHSSSTGQEDRESVETPRQDLLAVLAGSPQRLKASGPAPVSIAETDINPEARLFSEELSAAFRVWEDVYVDRLARMKGGLQKLRVEEMEVRRGQVRCVP